MVCICEATLFLLTAFAAKYVFAVYSVIKHHINVIIVNNVIFYVCVFGRLWYVISLLNRHGLCLAYICPKDI